MNIPIVYEDNWILVANKPSGLLTIPTPKNETRTLTSILGLHPCHRLDRETSGLIIYAKGKSIQKKITELFKNRKVKKTYIAFAQGVLSKDQGEIKNMIESMSAITRYKVIQRRKDFSIVEVNPLTGRTNQIRIHFKQLGHPIVGESKYVFRKDFALRAKRLCLHAKELEFTHPYTGKLIKLTADLPVELNDFLNKH